MKKRAEDMTVDAMVEDVTRTAMRACTDKDGRLNAQGRELMAVLEQADGEEPKPDEPGKYHSFHEIVMAYRHQVDVFRRRGCDLSLLNPLAREVKARISEWDKRHHPQFLQFFYYQYCEGCRDAMLEGAKKPAVREAIAAYWKKLLTPRVYPPWQRPLDAPMPHWPRSRRSSSR